MAFLRHAILLKSLESDKILFATIEMQRVNFKISYPYIFTVKIYLGFLREKLSGSRKSVTIEGFEMSFMM